MSRHLSTLMANQFVIACQASDLQSKVREYVRRWYPRVSEPDLRLAALNAALLKDGEETVYLTGEEIRRCVALAMEASA